MFSGALTPCMKYCCPTGKNIFLRVRNIFCVQLEICLPTHVVQLVPVLLRRLVLSVPLYFLNLAICLQPLKSLTGHKHGRVMAQTTERHKDSLKKVRLIKPSGSTSRTKLKTESDNWHCPKCSSHQDHEVEVHSLGLWRQKVKS